MITSKEMHSKKHMMSSQTQVLVLITNIFHYPISAFPQLFFILIILGNQLLQMPMAIIPLLLYLLSFSWDNSFVLVLIQTHIDILLYTLTFLFSVDTRFMWKRKPSKEYIGIIHTYVVYRHITYDEKFIILFIQNPKESDDRLTEEIN